jgi:signal transduction histidine kinase
MDQVGNNFYRSPLQSFIQTLRDQSIFSFFFVFLTVVGALKANQYIFYHFDTSPAVILMPTGIGLAALYLWGYRMWFPIFVAWFCALLTSPAALPLYGVGIGAVAYTLQVVVGAYVLKKFDFLGTLSRTRCALIVVGVALFIPTIAPTITTLLSVAFGSLKDPAWETWSRAWAGGVLSILVFTPLMTTWYRDTRRKTTKLFIESVLALLALTFTVYLTYWTNLPQANVFLILYLLFAALFWIGLRMHPRIMATAIFIITAVGMAGSIFAHPSSQISIASQLFADELFIVLIAPIFYILSALVEERQASTQAALAHARELEEANKKLSREDQAKNEFLATLAHELRNPLAPVVSSLELIKVKAQGQGQQDILDLADVAATHNATLIQLIDDLLEVSRISQNKLKLKMERVSLTQVVAQAARTVEALYQSRGHSLAIEMPHEEISIVADPLRLEQILVNLLNNAAKYTKEGGSVVMRLTHSPGDGLLIRIKDTGIGIEPSMFEKIFEPFVQSAVGGSGLGIGLSLTKRLVELHGGSIMV